MHGDGLRLVPKAVASLIPKAASASRLSRMATARPRIALIIDGPKGKAALRLARQMAGQVAMIVVDDQKVVNWTFPSFSSSHRLWRDALPMSRDAMFVDRTSKIFFRDDDTASLLLGADWMPPQMQL